MKTQRQIKILEIIQKNQIKTHEQLIKRLNSEGYDVTQSTVSRDIKDLGLIKLPSKEGGYIYSTPKEQVDIVSKTNMFSNVIISAEYSMNSIVIKTYPGMAPAVAASIDTEMKTEVLGSIAGDDTVLVIARTPEESNEVSRKIMNIFMSKGKSNA